MLHDIFTFYQSILSNLKDYPMAQNALVTTFSIAVSGGIGFLLIKSPKAITRFIKQQLMTSLEFNTQSSSWSSYNQEQFTAFLNWFSKNHWFKYSRIITIDGDTTANGAIVGPGVGNHFFFFRYRLYCFTVSEVNEGVTQGNQKFKLKISTMGRSHKGITQLMDQFIIKTDRSVFLQAFCSNTNNWEYVSKIPVRPLTTVFYNDRVKKELIEPIQAFDKNKEWYHKHGLNHKLTILLYGPPGTGKSSLIGAIATELKRDLYVMRPTGGMNYEKLFQQAANGLVFIEDIDTYSFSSARSKELTIIDKKRKENEPEEIPVLPEDPNSSKSIDEFLNGSLSDFLNALDGVLRINNVIVVMSTNCIEKLDAALIREGRVDIISEVGYLEDKEIRQFFTYNYPEYEIKRKGIFNPVPGAKLHSLLIKHKMFADRVEAELE